MLRTVGLVRLANPSLQQVGTTTCRRQKLPSTSTHFEPGPSGSKPSGLLEFRVAPWIPGESSASG